MVQKMDGQTCLHWQYADHLDDFDNKLLSF